SAMFVNEMRAKPSRHIEVDLQSAALPITTDGVPKDEFQLRSVECAFTWVEGVVDPGGLGRGNQCLLGGVPNLVATYALGGAIRELDAHIFKTEIPVDVQNQLRDRNAFRGDLLFRNKDVPIVLGECADPHQSVQGTRWLITVHLAELGKPHGQLAIAA